MPVFRYRAVDAMGRRKKDVIDAPDESVVADRLRRNGLTLIDVARVEHAASMDIRRFLSWPGWVRTADVVLFFRMFSALINSNIPISEAMAILRDQVASRALKRVISDILDRIEGGMPLSQAMAAHPRVFDPLLTGMIRAAELGGILDATLERIADMLERRAALRRKIITSMIYPAIVAIAAVAVVVFMVTFVIPKFAVLLGGRRLPPSTQFILDVSAFMNTHAGAIGLGAAGVVALIFLVMLVPETRIRVDRYRIYIPLMGPVFRYGVVVQYAQTLSSLLKSGITLVDALRAAGETIGNLAVKSDMETINDKVSAGDPLSLAMAQDRFFPPMVLAMVRVGEHSGLMDQAWETVGRIFEGLLADRIARMSAMVEPALIVTMGGLVGYVAWGLVAGILAMYST